MATSPAAIRLNQSCAGLKEQGLVMVEDIGTVLVARLTERGADVAAGRAIVPGVKRPGAGADMGRKSTIHRLGLTSAPISSAVCVKTV